MKKKLLSFCLILTSLSGFSQTINAGSEEFNKVRKDGFSMSLPIEQKNIEKDWLQYLNNFGDVEKSKGTYTLAKGKVPKISADPILIQSKVGSINNKSTIFLGFDLGGGRSLPIDSEEFKEVERMMKDFYQTALMKEEIRLAEKDSDEAKKNQERVTKTSERLKRDTERNAKDLESLNKKIEENKAQAIQIQKDIDQNLKDIESAKTVLSEKSKVVEKLRNLKKAN